MQDHILRLQHHTGFYESTGGAAAAREKLYTDLLATASAFVESFQPQAERRGITLKFEGVRRTSGKTTAIVVVQDANNRLNGSLATFLASHIRSDSIQAFLVDHHNTPG